MSDFVHLHCHTEYSLLDGAIRLKDLCSRAKDFGMTAACVTDHGNMHAAAHFYKACKSVEIKPIIGCEVYTCHDHLDKSSDNAKTRNHLILLAQNDEGYHNLARLVTRGWLDGFYYKPRVDKGLLRQYAAGLICLSACLSGEIPRAILDPKRGMDAAIALAREYAQIYPGRFFLELQENGLASQKTVNTALLEIAEKTGLPLVATNDCHYLDAGDADAHEVLLCIQTQNVMSDPNRYRLDSRDLYYKSPEEMERAFAYAPEAIANTARIAQMCDVTMEFGRHFFPVYNLPEGMTPEAEFRRLAEEGLERRLAAHPDRDTLNANAYRERLQREIGVILEMGFPGYFLIVQDFINWAKNHGIPVGPGRGSAAGSLVAWALRITNLDPLPYNLLFERFLNSERVSLPDIDVDFCERRRGEVIQYMVDTYGKDNVAQITTFGKMKAKAVVRDVGRALGMTPQETDRIAKLIPNALEMTIDLALKKSPDLAREYTTDKRITDLLDTSRRLEGLSRHASTHAAGVVVSDKPMVEYLPLYKLAKAKKDDDPMADMMITQYDMKMVEQVGLVKFDFLGLKTMTLIHDALDAISLQGKERPDLDTLPLTDPAVYELYSLGDTDGIFQVESQGMRRYLMDLRPTCFEDIIAMLALYRPGPLESGMVDEFIKRKHGEVPVDYIVDSLQDCLRDTYGVIVYQEQVMQIAQIIAGYTLGGADLLRRAMGKKNPEAMAEQRSFFLEGARKNGVDEAKANEIFDLMEKFARYGFNKSHSAAYALVSYHTAYLKAHYKVEFMAALLTSEMGNQDKLLKYIASCKDMDIDVLQPSVNDSRREFTALGGKVVFGLGGIKNVGGEAINEIITARESGPYTSLLDLAYRVNLRKVTKRVLEALINGGACDCLGVSRAGLLHALDAVVTKAQKRSKERASNQISLLSVAPDLMQESLLPGIGFDCPEAHMPEMDNDVRMRLEKEALGFFLTSHPLLPFKQEMRRLDLTSLEDARETPPGGRVRCAVLVTTHKLHYTKAGKAMAFASVEDLTGHAEVTIFSRTLEECRELLASELPLVLEGHIDRQESSRQPADTDYDTDKDDDTPREVKIICDRLLPLEHASQQCHSPVTFALPASHLGRGSLLALRGILQEHPGEVPVQGVVDIDNHHCWLSLDESYAVKPGIRLDAALRQWARNTYNDDGLAV